MNYEIGPYAREIFQKSSWRYRIMFGRGFLLSYRLVGLAWVASGLFLFAPWLGR
jgi:hypothetical protein